MLLYIYVFFVYLYKGVESHNCPYCNAEIDVTEEIKMLDIMLNVRIMCIYNLYEKINKKKNNKRRKRRRRIFLYPGIISLFM